MNTENNNDANNGNNSTAPGEQTGTDTRNQTEGPNTGEENGTESHSESTDSETTLTDNEKDLLTEVIAETAKEEKEEVNHTKEFKDIPEEELAKLKQDPAYIERVRRAFEGKEMKILVHKVNHIYPNDRTAFVLGRLEMLKNMQLGDEGLLSAVEEVDSAVDLR